MAVSSHDTPVQIKNQFRKRVAVKCDESSTFFQAPNIAHPKKKKISGLALRLPFHRFSSFNCYLSVVL